MDALIFLIKIIAVYGVLYFFIFYFTLLLFVVLMPLKNKHGEKILFKLLAGPIFLVGFLLDIVWNIFFFSPYLYLMNKADSLSKKFWPQFSDVNEVGALYKITLTARLQHILDSYPKYSNAYNYAASMAIILNKYDPGHLEVKK